MLLQQLLRIIKLTLRIVLLLMVITAGIIMLQFARKPVPKVAEIQPDNQLPPSTSTIAETWQLKSIATDLSEGAEGKQIRYGYDLITKTYQHLGPELKNPLNIFTGNNLSCQNCHLEAGTKRLAASYVGVYQRFPQFKGREGKVGTLEDRINGCMERSMNGRCLPDDSPEMQAMVAYMQWLSEDVPEEVRAKHQGFTAINLPNRPADTLLGNNIYQKRCAVCHGTDGQGQRAGEMGDQQGYRYPPLWGPDSYNHGAGMNRLIKAAQFIKGNMPLGASADNPLLSDEEVYDLAGFINAHDRPKKEKAENDYPDLTLKPVDAPYGPYADTFPTSQHQLGPFPPISDYYKHLKNTREP